jgi:hypothetical protein
MNNKIKKEKVYCHISSLQNYSNKHSNQSQQQLPWTWSSSLSFEGELKSTYILSEFHVQGRALGHEKHCIFIIPRLTGEDDHKARRKSNHPDSVLINPLKG